MMNEFILSLIAGWIVGVLFGWLKLPLPAPPLMGFVGALGILFDAWSIEQLKHFLLR
jgi:XapX domain-containing protein